MSTLLVLVGLLAVLGGTFGAGFLSGRHWERVRVLIGLVKPQAPHAERARVPGRAADPVAPALTFYQDLTAPLASPAPRHGKTDTARKPEGAVRGEPGGVRPEAPRAVKEPPSPAGYTVQVAAYATRAQADGLVARLASQGFPADVSEATTSAGIRYRVRVGHYPTRDAARDAAARLATETRLGGFVAGR
jgi:cell division septation protein DedD